ncbi:MAG: type II toxin-antitoxin system prevent-host-death family antitoxin [Roseitalea sp.]|jgi:prevent-host-death family protein|nr:type II toxin-antitoxin system prevent-host-death family antitoxin [Roseitalea sp.]MBO6724013.1 type II toxin-antitoxin system prevent-host-death family antitoxin [Roseitalea sp.]MBO6741809.1 type II toxin-antitoxin system prevent-host-death family antitoxin [Roseitalea sp.]
MDEFGILDARNNFSALVERAEKGEEVIITRHGKPVVKLTAVDADEERAKRREAIRQIREMRKSISPNALDGTSIKDMINEGRG